ncbi:MAG: AAA family ATPase [Muribaculaceae bacterium]|nr:AAA family ATPase [Muribaculaceae bacterium]
MTSSIIDHALATLPYTPLPTQLRVLHTAAAFAMDSLGEPNSVLVLNGYAGTGKTSLTGALIKALDMAKKRVVILAPTGRAAKIASRLSAHKASTIHRRIFRPNPADPTGRSHLVAPNPCRDTLYIIDEASLIGDMPGRSLLATLIRYVYSGPGCRMMLIGDEAQLPPVGQESSTAMLPERLRALGLDPICTQLDIPLRQQDNFGIVHNATRVRLCLTHTRNEDSPLLEIDNVGDVQRISSVELPDLLANSYATVGDEETIIITRSNMRANRYNMAVRNMVMFAESPLERGDRVMVAKNDYFWAPKNRVGQLIANGDMGRITSVGHTEKMYGRYFCEVEMELDGGEILAAEVMLRSLAANGPAIPREEMERFGNRVMEEYEGEWSERMKARDEDPYYNALQLKYSYCVTAHKAQGGQWRHVYIDMSGIGADAEGPEFYRWLYTALTRATDRVYLIDSSF